MFAKWIIIITLLFGLILPILAQDDLLDQLDKATNEETVYTTATFKATRIINGQSVERMKAKQLDIRIHHRFGTVNKGYKNFYGLDESNILLSAEYGLTDKLMVGIGRTTIGKTVNGFLKYNVMEQCKGKINRPVTVTLFTAMDVSTDEWLYTDRKDYFSNRLTYVFQALVARKFGDHLSLQLSPTFIHRNLVPLATDMNDVIALGIEGRYKISRRIALTAEFFPVLRPVYNYSSFAETNSLSVGVDLETGGHVFQIMFTNSVGMIEKDFIGETTQKWTDGAIRLGFNISRVFSLK
ncbi:MAG: DUF5777 family beta-barrel protein [Salinivirgaceae bacterium]